MEAYLNEHFSMYHGYKENVTIRAMNVLLDTFVDRFGTRDAIYTNDGDNYFTARVTVSVSEQFFGWLCGLGNKVKIEAPQSVKNEYAEYLTKILKLHT